MLGGNYVNLNNPPDAIVADTVLGGYELPALRLSGQRIGAFGIASGGLAFYAGTQGDAPSDVRAAEVTGGAMQLFGGVAVSLGSYVGDAAIMEVGGMALTSGGIVATVPVLAYQGYQGVQAWSDYLSTYPQSITDLYLRLGSF